MSSFVDCQGCSVGKGSVALAATERLLSRVDAEMLANFMASSEGLTTDFTRERLLSRVCEAMAGQLARRHESRGAKITGVRLLPGVQPCMVFKRTLGGQ